MWKIIWSDCNKVGLTLNSEKNGQLAVVQPRTVQHFTENLNKAPQSMLFGTVFCTNDIALSNCSKKCEEKMDSETFLN